MKVTTEVKGRTIVKTITHSDGVKNVFIYLCGNLVMKRWYYPNYGWYSKTFY
jgi:hypothetical protein